MTSANKTPHHSVIIIGGGQAGLSASYYLQQRVLTICCWKRAPSPTPGGPNAGMLSAW
ncbi:hypothetical protein ULG90_08650 [Halopseudomonas pachastrellae]|nr:hypothetical protein ULG90_08650 [Halopseudomonas pachastrellae]